MTDPTFGETVLESGQSGAPEVKASAKSQEPSPQQENGQNRSHRRTSVADPIHGLIQFDRNDPSQNLLLSVMNSKAFQRLRRIKQMGLAEFVFPGATHSRFVHSIGSASLMMQVIDHFNRSPKAKALLDSHYGNTNIPLSRLLLLGILVHDIGHTPLSHTLEDILELENQGLLHDKHWNKKILLEDKELQRIWKRFGTDLPKALLDFMGDDGVPKHFLAQLISSQLDMDRLDYLQRDSHFLGVQYGRIEAARIIANLEIAKLPNGREVVAVREESVPAIEHYLFGRHQAYKMALHSLDKASEALLKKVLQRFHWVRQQGIETGDPADELYQLMTDGKSLTTERYLRMDDCYLWEKINKWANHSEDKLLSDLANRMLRHNLLKFVDLAKYGSGGASVQQLEPVYEALKQHYEKRGLPLEFCFEETLVHSKPMYQPPDCREPIWILTARGHVVDLREVSSFSLSVKPKANLKHLLFVWDREAMKVLTEVLEKHLPIELPDGEEYLENEGWL